MSASARSSLGYLKPYKPILVAGVLSLLITNLCMLGVPYYLSRAGQARYDHRLDEVPHEALLLIVFAMATAVTRIGSRVWIFNAARAAEYDVRSDLFGHLLTLSPGYFRDHSTGDVMSRLTNDVQTVRAMWGAGLVHLTNATTSFATVLTYMIWIDWKVALLVILPYPLIFLVGQALSRRIYISQRDVQAVHSVLTGRIQEDLGALRVLKRYGLEAVRRQGFLEGSKRLLDKTMTAAQVRLQLGPTLHALVFFVFVLLF